MENWLNRKKRRIDRLKGTFIQYNALDHEPIKLIIVNIIYKMLNICKRFHVY